MDLTSDTGMTEPANILFISATVPYPATDGGRIRVLNLVRRLCRTHKVTLLTFIASPDDEKGIVYLREIGIEVIGIRREQRKLMMALGSLLQCLIHRKPLTVAKYYSAKMARTLKSLLTSREFSIIHFEMLHMGQYLSVLRANSKSSCATILGEQNIDSSIWRRLAREELIPLKKLIFYWQHRSFRSYERRICPRFDLCLCVSTQDQGDLESICPGVITELVPNGVDPNYFKSGEDVEDETRLVFTGSMDWKPNEDAVEYFCYQILDHVRGEIPEVEFYIVGSNPTKRVLELGNIRSVTVTGWVEDVRPYIASAAVFVVPLRIGGGTRLKILQALAMGKSVVSTPIGCEGLDLQPDRHLLVADWYRPFAEATVKLMKDRAMRQRLAENGKKLVQERHDWDVVIEKLELAYRKAISGQ